MEMLAALSAGQLMLSTLFVVVCVLPMLIVLIQKGRGGGLSGAFGGVGGHSAFGAKTGDVFTWITVGLAAAFILLAVVLNFAFREIPIAATVTPPAPVGAAPVEDASQSGATESPEGAAPAPAPQPESAAPAAPAAPEGTPAPAPEKPAQ